MVVSLSAAVARRIALGAQGFADPQPKGRVDRRHFRRVMDRMGVLQLDSVPVICRSHYLPFFARLGPYSPDHLDVYAWHSGEWYETWGHEASLMPVATEPLMRWRRAAARTGETWGNLFRLAQTEAAYIDEVYAQVAERGPLQASELDDPRPRSGEWWGSRSVGSIALDWLFRIGELGIRRNSNFEKSFDLYDNIIPGEVRKQPTLSVKGAQRELLMMAGRSLGVGTVGDLVDYFRLSARTARPLIGDLIEDGQLVEVHVEGWKEPGLLAVDAKRPRQLRRSSLLSPFDPVVWCRPRAERLFGFEYKIEIYVPKAKRNFGYYVLPFLLDDRLVARVDLKTDRRNGALRVLGAFGEKGDTGAIDQQEVVESLAENLMDLARHLGVGEVAVERIGPGDLLQPLTKALT